MMDEEQKVLPGQGEGHDGELLLYDFFKHLTSLAILALGGVLALSQSADPADVKRAVLLATLICISLGGILAFSGSSEIARARYTRTPIRQSLAFYRLAAPALLAVGVGMFLSMFADSLD